jgi:hypothetical protein
MLAFRSEEHVDRWLAARRHPRGAAFTLEQAWQLARAWYHDRLDPAWRRKTTEEAEAFFARLGLAGDFWRLRPSD